MKNHTPSEYKGGLLHLRKRIMKVKAGSVLVVSACLTACAAPGTENYQTIIDSATSHKADQIIRTKVVDTPFLEYMRVKPGIIVLRSELPRITGAAL